MKPIEVVLVEDDVNVAEIVRLYLEQEGYTVYTSYTSSSGHYLIESIVPKVAILDVNLPGQSGFQLAERFRELSDGILIFLTGEKTKEKIMQGFNIGCDDYVTKPFDPQELIARVKANLRRIEVKDTKESEVLKVQDLTINYKDTNVFKNGELLELSKKEKMLLFYLSKHINQVISVETLYDVVWGYDAISDIKTVSVHMSTLRKKIEEDVKNPIYIETIRGFGYKFKME